MFQLMRCNHNGTPHNMATGPVSTVYTVKNKFKKVRDYLRF